MQLAADHRHAAAIATGIAGLQRASEHGADAERGEEVVADAAGGHLQRLDAVGDERHHPAGRDA